MAFCTHCGTQLEDGKDSCTECGTRRPVSSQPPAASTVAPAPPPAALAPISASAAPAQAPGPQGIKPADVKGRGGLKVILIAACVLVFLGAIVAGLITYAGYRISRTMRGDGSGATASAVAGRTMTAQEAAGDAADTIPSGWKVTRDPTGSFEVATPPHWQMGREFFLQREKAETRKIGDMSVQAPPSGLAMWGIEGRDREKMSQLPEGKRFQIRCSLVRGDAVCSVWRIKGPEDFTPEEKNTMKQVGKTLRWVE